MDSIVRQSIEPGDERVKWHGVEPHLQFVVALGLDAVLGNTQVIGFCADVPPRV